MINILVNGCNGKMGQIVCELAQKDPNLLVTCGIDRNNSNIYPFPVYSDTSEIIKKPDVIIDFSIPTATLCILKYAKNNNIPIVIATTGLTIEDNNEIINASNQIPVFKSANMSYNINLMQRVLEYLTPLLSNSDIEIIETHHNRKVDSPSGTALMLADTINKKLNNEYSYIYNRHENKNSRSKNEIGISSIRGGNIVGEHSVKFFSENETFEITHTSYSRNVFAEGAIRAAKFLVSQKEGLYTMQDLI